MCDLIFQLGVERVMLAWHAELPMLVRESAQ
jgi:hypothetical protein